MRTMILDEIVAATKVRVAREKVLVAEAKFPVVGEQFFYRRKQLVGLQKKLASYLVATSYGASALLEIRRICGDKGKFFL